MLTLYLIGGVLAVLALWGPAQLIYNIFKLAWWLISKLVGGIYHALR